MPIDLEALNKQIGGVLPGPKTERSNVYIPTKEEQNNSGYNTHYSFEDTTEDLKNKIASQQGFGDWISKVPLTFGAAVVSGAAATGGVVIEASKIAGAALWTPLENFDSYMSGSNKWHSFASNYEAGNPLIDFAEGIKQMTKDWQLNYADNRTFMGKIEAFTESAINSLGEYGAIGGLTSFGAAASLAKLGIKGMAKNYTVGAIASYVGGAHEGIVNAREEFDYNYQNANEMLNKKYDKKLQDLATLKENEGLDEEAYNLKLQEIDKSYKEEQEYIHDVLNQSALSTIAFNTAAIGTMNLLEFNLFGNSYNLLEAGIRKLKGKSKLYDNILSPALGKNIDEISYNDLLSIEANKVKASNWTSMKSWGMGSLAEGSEETISDSIKILSEGYAQDKLNEKKLAKNYNGQNFMDKWLSYMSSPEMIETFIGGAYAGGLTQGGMRVIGKMMGKDTQEQEELMTYTRELLETQKPIKETLEKITQKGAAIDQAVKYLENKEYDKYNAAISQIFNSNIINSIEKGTFNVNKAVLQNQIKENNDKISKLESEKLADTTPDLVSKKQEEIKNLKLYNENVKTGVKILENYEKTYNHYKEVYGNDKIAEIVIGKDVEIEFARNYLKQMDLTRTVEDSDSFRIRDLALKLNGKIMGDRVAKAITINDYYKAISETYKSIVNDFKLLGDDATEDDMLEMKKEIEELKEFSEIATTSFIQKEIFENSIKDNIAFKNKIDRDVDFRLKLTEESMSKELRKEIESELEDTYYAKRRKQLIVDLIGKLKKEGLSQEEVVEIEKSLKKEWVDDTLIDNYNQQQIDSQTVNQSKIEDTVEDDEEEIIDETKDETDESIKEKTKKETKTKKTQAEKTSTNESINEQESIQIREELLDKLFKKDFVHLFQFKSNKQSDIQEISEKIKSLFEVLKEFFDANENLLTTDKKAIVNEVNFNVFYEFTKEFDSIKSKFPFIQEFENKANDESLSEEDLDALIEENRLLYDSYLELMSDLNAVKEKLSSKSTKKEIKDFLTIPEDDGSDFIDDYAIKVLNFIDVITTLKEDKSNEEEVVKLIESNNEDYDSTVIYASLDPIKKNSLEKIIDDEYTVLTKLDVNNTLTSSTLEYDEASDTVNGAKKKNGVVPETTKKILSGEYNGKNYVLRLESNLEIEEQPITEIDKLNEHELEKLKLMVDRLKRIYSGIDFQFATVNELRDQLPDDQKKFADKYRAVYIKNKGKIVFNINNRNLSYETAIHEIAHPLIVLIQQQNGKLYSELLDISKTLDKDNTTIQNFVLKNYFESRSEQQLTYKERLNYEHECIAHALEISGSKGITYQERLDKKTNNKKLLIIQKFRRKFEEIIKYLIKAVMKKFFKTSSILKDEKGNPAIFKGLMTNKQIEIKMSDINYDMSLDMLSDLMLSLKVKIDLSSVSENSSKEDIILGSMKEEINKIQRNKQKGC